MIVIFDNEEQKNNFIYNKCPDELGYLQNPICLESCKECLNQYINMFVMNQEEQKELIIKTKTEINIALQNAIMDLGYEPYNEKTEKLYKTIGMALAKLQLLEEQGCKVIENNINNKYCNTMKT